MPIELPDGVRFLELTPEKVQKIWEVYNGTSGICDDFHKDNFAAFMAQLQAPNCVWLERTDGNGVLYATNVVPRLCAFVHFIYWDRKLAGTERMTMNCIDWLVRVADLQKINAQIPDFAKAAQCFALRLGFKREGVLRRASFSQGRLYDAVFFGMTKEEVHEWVADKAVQNTLIDQTQTQDCLTRL